MVHRNTVAYRNRGKFHWGTTGKPYTVQYLVELLNIQANSIYSRYDPNSQTDIAILLGTDWAENNSMP